MMHFSALLLGLLAVQAQEEERPGAKWTIDFKLAITQDGDEWVFSVAGTTDIPPEAVLRARIYSLEIVNDPRRGRREDEEPLVWEDDEGQPSYRTLTFQNGQFREEVYRFTREPWALLYRARIHYIPRFQNSDPVLRHVGEDEFSRFADLRYRTPEHFARQLKERVQEVIRDLVTLETMFKDLTGRVEKEQAEFDPIEWKVWKASFNERIERLEGLNRERYNLWAVWMEKQARMRVGGMCELLRRILRRAHELLANKELTDEQRKAYVEGVERLVDGFPPYFEEAIEVMKLPIPLDPDKVGPILDSYARAFAPLRDHLEDGKGDRAKVRARVRREGVKALMELIPLFQNRKSAYRFANEISARFHGLIDLLARGADDAALRKALKSHDYALRDFKKFARLE